MKEKRRGMPFSLCIWHNNHACVSMEAGFVEAMNYDFKTLFCFYYLGINSDFFNMKP